MELELTCPKCEKPYRVEVEASLVSAMLAAVPGWCQGCRGIRTSPLAALNEAFLRDSTDPYPRATGPFPTIEEAYRATVSGDIVRFYGGTVSIERDDLLLDYSFVNHNSETAPLTAIMDAIEELGAEDLSILRKWLDDYRRGENRDLS